MSIKAIRRRAHHRRAWLADNDAGVPPARSLKLLLSYSGVAKAWLKSDLSCRRVACRTS